MKCSGMLMEAIMPTSLSGLFVPPPGHCIVTPPPQPKEPPDAPMRIGGNTVKLE